MDHTSWTENYELLVTKWKTHAEWKGMLHEKAADRINVVFYTLGIISVLASCASTYISFTQVEQVCTSSSNGETTVQLNLDIMITIILTISATLFTGLQTVLNLEKKASKHRNVSIRYENLVRDIDEQLSLPIDQRELPKHFTKKLKKELTSAKFGFPKLLMSIPPDPSGLKESFSPISSRHNSIGSMRRPTLSRITTVGSPLGSPTTSESTLAVISGVYDEIHENIDSVRMSPRPSVIKVFEKNETASSEITE